MSRTLSDEHRQLLEQLLAASPDEEEEERFNPRPFREMLTRGYSLTPKQFRWLHDTHDRICGSIHYENLVSSGKVPRGKEVELLVRDKPLRPPVRPRVEN